MRKLTALVMMPVALGLAAPAAAADGNGVGTPFELTFWQSVAGSDDPAVYEAYLEQYPAGTFSALARVKVANLRKIAGVARTPAKSAVVVAAVLPPVEASAQVGAPVPIAAANQADADSVLLAQLAKSQEIGGAALQVAAAHAFALPVRPLLNEVPDLLLPGNFCSAEQRNAFYDTRYKPVLELSRANNAAALAHMQKLQQSYDSLQLARDTMPMNVVAGEAREYQQQVAAMTYSRQAAMVRQFDTIMAVPINACQVVAAR